MTSRITHPSIDRARNEPLPFVARLAASPDEVEVAAAPSQESLPLAGQEQVLEVVQKEGAL